MANRFRANNLCRPAHRHYLLLLALLGLVQPACADALKATSLHYTLLQSSPQDARYFTQGLEIHQGQLLQSSGLYGKSKLVSRPLNAEPQSPDAKLSWQQALPKNYFAEGLTVLDDTVYLLSWREQTLWRFELNSGKLRSRSTYQGEGWGLSNNGKHLIRSDGSDTLYFHDPTTLTIDRQIAVTRRGTAVKNINELEFAHGLIWANIWFSSEIIAIDPATGHVVAVLDVAELARRERTHNPDPNAVTNGIAYDARDDTFWVTGKHWSNLYQLKLNTQPLNKP